MYASVSMSNHASLPDKLRELREQGFMAFKMGWGPFGRQSKTFDESIVRAAREAVGADVLLMEYNNIFDNSAARADLNFRYRISLLEGVGRIVAWLDERDRIHDQDEPAVYDAIIKAWERLVER